MREVWRPVDEFPRYHVSNFGRIKISDTGKVLRLGRHRGGYVQNVFWDGDRYHARYIHRLVAKAFIGNIDGFQVDHLDNDRANNHVDNLEIVTRKVNNQRGYDRGRLPVNMKTVRIVDTDEEFRSISDCARFLNKPLSSVSYAFQNKTKIAGVYIEEVNLRGVMP